MRKKIDPIESDFIQLELGSVINWQVSDSDGVRTRHEVVCGGCGKRRMITRAYIQKRIKNGERYTGLCDVCSRFISEHSKADPVESDFTKLEEGSQINWAVVGSNKHGQTTHQVVCGHCGQTRMVERGTLVSTLPHHKIFTGLCQKCAREVHPLPRFGAGKGNPAFKRGYLVNGSGYVVVLVSILPAEDRAIAEPMSVKTGATRRVSEHRLVMARHLGRPLVSSEIVHHRNGIRTDNRIENLELLTRDTHFPGHDHDYQSAQERLSKVESEIEQLREMVIALGGNPDKDG